MSQESTVTIAVARFLGEKNWRVISIALPSGGSGTTFRSKNPDIPEIVPDLIAKGSASDRAIIVEAKPTFSQSDVDKLKSIRTGVYKESIWNHLSMGSNDLILCLAFAGKSEVDYAGLGIDLVLTVDGSKQVNIEYDREKIFS
jgi:hypothetical protein